MPVATLNDCKQALWDRFRTGFAALVGTLPDGTVIGAVPFYGDNVSAQPGITRYLVFSVLPGVARQITCGPIGQRTWRQPGFVVVAIYVALNTGDADATILGDSVSSLLRGVTVGGNVILRAPHQVRVGEVKGLYRTNVMAEFYYDFTA